MQSNHFRSPTTVTTLLIAFISVICALPLVAGSFLFDASHMEMAANADWIIDSDLFDLYREHYPCGASNWADESNPQRFPTPDQSLVVPATLETYWTGGISAWAIELVKAGHSVETLPYGAAITFGDGGNVQDLSNYDVFIVPEPNTAFTAGEITAILSFVNAGGGLFMVADHDTSDRDCDNFDSPRIFNLLMGTAVSTSTTPPFYDPIDPTNNFGLFGIWFYENDDDGSSAENKEFDWFTEGDNNNVETAPGDPIIDGPFGSGAGGLGFFGSTQMGTCTDASMGNPTALAHVWRNGQAHTVSPIGVSERVTFATAQYGAGRVAGIGDSSPADDGTGDPGDGLYDGWDKADFGVNNKEIHLNACYWLLNPVPDTTPPLITVGPASTPADCSAVITWTTDESATSTVDYGLTVGYGSSETVPGFTTDHSVTLTGLSPITTYHYMVSSTDSSGNGPTTSSDATFITLSDSLPNITSGPTESGLSHSSVTIAWTTDEAGDSVVQYGLTPGLGTTESISDSVTSHSVDLTGLTPETLYYYRVETTDSCGNTVQSTEQTFSTTIAPALVDISGWTLHQYSSSQSFTFPADTFIPADGYLVVSRNATQAAYEAEWGALPPGTVFVNSGDKCPMINGGESFELVDNLFVTVDGVTITMAENTVIQRNNPGDPPGSELSWTVVTRSAANPGGGAGAGSSAGVVINEAIDSIDFNNDSVELYYDAGSATPDTTPPVISGVGDSAGECSALITWTTDEDADSVVEYGTSDPPAGSQSDAALVTSHSETIPGLLTGTLYYYRVGSSDGSGNGPTWSSVSTFTTSESYPVISNVAESAISNTSATITWNTDENATRVVEYGTTLAYGATTGSGSGTAHSVDLSSLTPDTPYHYRVRSTDDCGLETISEDAMFVTAPDGTGPSTDHLVISQVQTRGASSHDDEFIEIYNPTGASVSLAGWSIQYKSATGTTYLISELPSVSIGSHGYYLLAQATGYTGSVTPDTTYTFLMGASGGNLFLVNSTAALSGLCSTDASIIDKVAWGNGNCPETTAATAHAAGESLVRKPGGSSGSGEDTDHNFNDFIVDTTPDPHNSASPPASPASSLGNVRVSLFLTPGAGTTDLDWGSAAGATGYYVYWGTTPDFMSGTPDSWQTVISVSDDSRAASPIYYYDVRATDGVEISID